ncbi:MAG: hypothetical protein IT541_15675 [Hyphomicrobiales bacterium]|nr:hypothetical protein [Hyphomicrobiales bacterium]
MATSKKRSSETNKPPVARLRIGLIAASIWERDTENGSFYSVTFERRYKDSEGEWQSTHSYNADDLLVLAKLADQAHSRILELQSEEAE